MKDTADCADCPLRRNPAFRPFTRDELAFVTRFRSVETPVTQAHLADAPGLSLVHTNKTLKRLVARGLLAWQGGRIAIRDEAGLARTAGYDAGAAERLPLIRGPRRMGAARRSQPVQTPSAR